MGRLSRRQVVLALGLAATGLGCGGMNPFLLPYFVNHDVKTPAEFPLAVPPKRDNAKVVVFVSSALGLHPELAGVDRMLNAELIQTLDAAVKANEQKVLVLKMPKIDEFRADDPNWRKVHPYDIGKKFGADYVIDVEIQQMDLYKPGGRGEWLQGRGTISVSAYDLSKPLKEPAYKLEYSPEYPRGREEQVEDRDSRVQVSNFRMRFVQRIASEIAVKFVESTPQRRVD